MSRSFRSNGSIVHCRLAILLGALLAISPLHAFKPTAEFGHVGIVREAITPISRNTTLGVPLKFSARAILQIRDATAGVDEIFSARGELTTPTAHCDDELLPACSQRLIDIKAAVIAALVNERNGDLARAQLGRALHTLEDFYSHSNWVNLNGATHNPQLGMSTLAALPPTTQTCGAILDGSLVGAGLTSLTSGYFPPTFKPGGKCTHGILFGTGIHKDSPGRELHESGRTAAVFGTSNFVNQILDAIAGNDAALRAFMDVHPPVGFVIDNTGSMGPTIDGVKSAVATLVNNLEAADNEPDQYVLVVFGDPEVSSPFITGDGDALIAQVNTISAGGGDDCPELAMTGLLRAIGAIDPGGTLFLFTDATAKDGGLANNVVAAAKQKDVEVWVQQSGACAAGAGAGYDQDAGKLGTQHALAHAVAAPGAKLSADGHALLDSVKGVSDPFQFVTQETGGQLIISANSSAAVVALFNVVEPVARGTLETVALVEGQLPAGTRLVEFPVDGSMSTLLVSASLGAAGTVNLRRPNGNLVAGGDPDAVITPLVAGRIFKVVTPAVGLWKAELSGTAGLAFSVIAAGETPIAITRFDFVEERGREAHTGLYPISGAPVAGTEQTVIAGIKGEVNSAAFRLASPAGDTLVPLSLVQGGIDVAADDYTGKVTPPAGPTRVYVGGTTAVGHTYQRAIGQIVLAQAVKVEPLQAQTDAEIRVGQPFVAWFRVTNTGPSGNFDFTGANSLGAASVVAPPNTTIGAGAFVDVMVTVSVGLVGESLGTVSLVATGASATNSALLARPVRNDLPRFPPIPGQFPSFLSTTAGSIPWTVDTSTAAEGPESLRSGLVGHSQSTSVEFTGTFPAGPFVFARRVSSEQSFDFLRVFVDGVERGAWSGEQDWALISLDMTAGQHLVRWTYSKDGSVDDGQDAAWIDAISLSVFMDGFE